MTSYNKYPILLSAPPPQSRVQGPEAPEGPRLVEAPQVGSAEQSPRGTYHLNVVQAKRRGLIAKEKMFKKKYKKYNKILN